jgi:hypothetical protein
MNMIERAARAAAEQYGEDWDSLPDINPVQNGDLDRRHFIDQVRAILTAMREPTEAMIKEGGEYDSEGGYDTSGGPRDVGDHDRHTFEPNAPRIWRAMIDKALEEG